MYGYQNKCTPVAIEIEDNKVALSRHTHTHTPTDVEDRQPKPTYIVQLTAGRTVELHSTPIQHHHLLLLLLVRVMLTMCNMQESYTTLKNSTMYLKHATAVRRCLLLPFLPYSLPSPEDKLI